MRVTKHFKDRYLSVPWNTNVLQNSHGHVDLLVEDDVLWVISCVLTDGVFILTSYFCTFCRKSSHFSASVRGTCVCVLL
jgi:hypothetical protein